MERRDILIVDDDRQVREVLHQIFLGANYKCLLANDGHEGLEVFRASRPPLTVTDLKMPVMGGIELLQHIRQEDPDAAVIVLTGAADVKTAIASLQLGAWCSSAASETRTWSSSVRMAASTPANLAKATPTCPTSIIPLRPRATWWTPS